MSEIVWEDPPVATRGTSGSARLWEFAEALRQNPKRWALYPSPLSANSTRSTTAIINRGHWAGGEGFEGVSREGKLYVRFVGEDKA